MDALPRTLTPSPSSSTDDSHERAWSLALRIIDLTRGLIVSENPFLSSAIGLLKPASAQLDDTFACDGKTLYVDSTKLLANFSQRREPPTHDFTHVLLHGVLLHPFVGASVDGPSWDLAADIVAESLVAEIMGPRSDDRGTRIAAVLKQVAADLGSSLTTERLYHALRDGAYADERRLWAPLFHVDDHGLWPSAQRAEQTGGASSETSGAGGPAADSADHGAGRPSEADASAVSDGIRQQEHAQRQPDLEQAASDRASSNAAGDSPTGTPSEGGETEQDAAGTSSGDDTGPQPLSDSQLKQAEEAWSHAAKSMRVNLETISRNRGAGLGGLVRELDVGAHERVDYRTFLRQFAVEHEDMRLSDDEFDYIFYTYGLELYHDMPLIEPLEYRNEKRIRDFVIVIDTSSSVSDKVVQEFVNTTFDVLSSEGGFFAQTNIHIIQADARVQSDAKICSLADLDRWRRNIKLYGFGGTDFRPAFTYVQQLRQQGEFEDLQGLLYFTDGWGIYPDRMPPYKCAFVFYDEDHRPELVPPWAIQVVLHPGQFESMSVY